MLELLCHEYGRADDLAAAQALERLVGLLQSEGLHGRHHPRQIGRAHV